MLSQFNTIVPPTVHEGVLKLCDKICGGTPLRCPVRPDKQSEPDRCFDNVKNYVAVHGGRICHGWTIWEANIFIEAEFHAVWESPSKSLVCISSHHDSGLKELLFLPDATRTFVGLLQPNIGISWPDNPKVDRLLEAEFDYFSFLRKHQDPTTGRVKCVSAEVKVFTDRIELLRALI